MARGTRKLAAAGVICTFDQIGLRDIFIDPTFPQIFMRKLMGATDAHLGLYEEMPSGNQYSACRNKRVLGLLKQPD